VSRFVVAAAQYPIDRVASFDAYAAKIERWVADAAAAGARLAVFPEYGGMELTALDPGSVGDLHASIAALGAWIGEADALHARLAARYGVHICAGSLPVQAGDGRFGNHVRLFAPNGKWGVQRKVVMTRFERERWGIAGGAPLTLFETELGPIGIAICYDVEFPLLVRALVEAGAMVILTPSATDTLHGYHRVRIGAQARALENQCYVVQAPVVGEAGWTPALDESHGAAAIYGPPDLGFPADGVVAQGRLNEPGWVFGEVDLARVMRVRREGAVFNHHHWDEQGAGVRLPRVDRADLRG
jgi:predicted amidohydrolase